MDTTEWIAGFFILQCGAFIWMLVKLSNVQSALEQLRREFKAPVKSEIKTAPSKVQPPPVRPVPEPPVPPAAG